MPKSFITMHVTDPFSTAIEGGQDEYPNAKRNLLEAINNAEATTFMLPPPSQKENLAVFLRYEQTVQSFLQFNPNLSFIESSQKPRRKLK